MWVLRKLRAPRVNFRRNILLLVMGLAMAVFASVGPLASTALAADAEWSGDALLYEEKLYTRAILPDETDRDGFINTYESRDTTTIPPTRYVMYLPDGEVSDATSATLIVYNVVGGEYRPISEPTEVNIIRDLTGATDEPNTNCNVSGIGWIICPLSNYLAEGVDWVYGIVSNFFEVQTITKSDNGVYELWRLVRTIANVAFIGVFLAIIYSQITGAGYSNYNIKNMIPRLILGAALVNVSFWLCALAVDASNLLGHSIQALLENIRQNYVTPIDIPWSAVTAAILGGGTVAGIAGFAAATAGSGFSFSFLLLAALIPAGLSVLAAFIILAARQALIVVLTAVAPLAFVASVLPSTRGLFDKWRKLFTNMLIIFPAFALLFGASQLAGSAIIKTATEADQSLQLALVLVGLAIQVIPLALTPFLTRLSSGILGQVANFANNKQRGFSDRAKNWANDNAEVHKLRKQANTANDLQRRRNGEYMGRLGGLRARGIGRLGHSMDRKKRDRDADKKLSEELLANQHEESWERRLANPSQPGPVRQRLGMSNLEQRRHEQHSRAHRLKDQATTIKGAHDAHEEEEWNQYLQSNAGAEFRNLRRSTVASKERSKVMDTHMTNADELAIRALISRDQSPEYRELRRQSIESGVFSKEASAHQESIDKEAQEQWIRRQDSNVELRAMRRDATLAQKRTEVIDKSMTDSDQREYEHLVKTDAGYREIRDRRVQSIVDSETAQFDASEIDAKGKREYRRQFEDGVAGSRELRKQNVRIEQLKKETGVIESTLQDRADTHWEHVSRTDNGLQNLRLKQTDASDRHKQAELQWNKLVENIRAEGAAAPGVKTGNESLANSIDRLRTNIAVEERAIEAAKVVQSEQLAAEFKESMETGDRELLRRAGGIGGERAATRIYAKAKGDVVNAAVEEVKKTNRALTSEMTRFQLHKVMQKAQMPDGSHATVEMQQAAMYALLQEKGNNEDAQEIRDAIAMMGMMVDPDTGEYYEALRDPSNGHLIRNKFGFAQIDRSKKIVDKSEIERRRDWQQFFDDAKQGSKHSMVTYSGTNQSEARAGTMVDDMRGGFMRDAVGGKFSPEKMLKADVDELKFLLEDIHSPNGHYADLNDEQKAKVRDTLEGAILNLQGNENINAGIDDRNRGVMNDILAFVNPEKYSPAETRTVRDADGSTRQERLYRVGPDKQIIARGKDEIPGEKKFTAPIGVPGVHYNIPVKDPATGEIIGERGYYREWNVDLQLDDNDSPSGTPQ